MQFSHVKKCVEISGCLQEVQGMWEGYKETYSRLEPMRHELTLYMQKKNAGNKRKLAEMQQEAEQLMADADRYFAFYDLVF